ncbi:MAG: 2Fe-2S iron-sulfur cluster-binding protein [Geminicoccaceae bacterium]
MAKLIVTDRNGVEHELEGKPSWSVMEIVRENGLPIEASCGGCCACATCHVYVNEADLERLNAPSEDEEMMLDEAFEVKPNSRLSCQIPFDDSLDGLRVTLAPEF